MKRLITILALVLGSAGTARAVPVVPNFQQGSMTSHTETESTVTETINSIDYRTGWEYSVTGVGVDNNGAALNPATSTSTVPVAPTVGTGEDAAAAAVVTSSFDALNFSTQNNFTIAEPGGAFQFTQTYSGPGMTNQTIIQRVTSIQSVTDTTSTFTQ